MEKKVKGKKETASSGVKFSDPTRSATRGDSQTNLHEYRITAPGGGSGAAPPCRSRRVTKQLPLSATGRGLLPARTHSAPPDPLQNHQTPTQHRQTPLQNHWERTAPRQNPFRTTRPPSEPPDPPSVPPGEDCSPPEPTQPRQTPFRTTRPLQHHNERTAPRQTHSAPPGGDSSPPAPPGEDSSRWPEPQALHPE
ncbi:unnamed protein product [Merluccius merluccius]